MYRVRNPLVAILLNWIANRLESSPSVAALTR